MRAIAPDTGITVTFHNLVPGCRPEPDGAAETLARSLTGDNGRHVVSYGTEAGQFQEPGLSAVVCGPGSIAQAHQADEYLSVEQFAAGEAMLRRLIDRLAA
jgi:acetylornithine deacetylase